MFQWSKLPIPRNEPLTHLARAYRHKCGWVGKNRVFISFTGKEAPISGGEESQRGASKLLGVWLGSFSEAGQLFLMSGVSCISHQENEESYLSSSVGFNESWLGLIIRSTLEMWLYNLFYVPLISTVSFSRSTEEDTVQMTC